MSRLPALAAATVAVVLAGCGGSGDDEPAPPPPPRETVDKLAKLPESWHPYVDRRGGFALGLPRGWKARAVDGPNALIRSFDHLVAISIAPDRSAAALEVPIEEFAARTAEALPGLRGDLRRVRTRRYRHRYDGTELRARATSKEGIDQLLSVIVLRRDSVATVTVVIAANAKRSSQPSLRLACRVVTTVRTRPPRGDSGAG